MAVTGTSTAESDGADVPAPATLQSVTNVRVVYGLLLTRYSTSELPKVCAGRTECTFDPGAAGSSRSQKSDHVGSFAPAYSGSFFSTRILAYAKAVSA